MFLPQLIPQRMKLLIMRPNNIMAQFMQHGVHHRLKGQKLCMVTRMSQSELDHLTTIGIHPEKIVLVWVEFCEGADAPGSLAHDGFHHAADFAEGV